MLQMTPREALVYDFIQANPPKGKEVTAFLQTTPYGKTRENCRLILNNLIRKGYIKRKTVSVPIPRKRVKRYKKERRFFALPVLTS